MSSVIDATTVSRSNGKSDTYFNECIKVKFVDESNVYRSLVTADNQVNFHMHKLENGNTLRIEVFSLAHDSIVFRIDLTERLFKENPYFVKQQLTFDFKGVYKIITDFILAMERNKDSFVRCTINKNSSEKCVCELGLVAAAMTSKASFRIYLEPLGGRLLIEHLEKINDSTRKTYNKLLEKYRKLKGVEKENNELLDKIEEYKKDEQKYWTEKTQHQKQELALMGLAKENEELKYQLAGYKDKIRKLQHQIEDDKHYHDQAQRELGEQYKQKMKIENSQMSDLIEVMKQAHLKTKLERNQLLKDVEQVSDELKKCKAEVELLRSKEKAD